MPSLDDARQVVARYDAVAQPCGYAIGLYGSTLRDGYGNDIDLVAFNIFGAPSSYYPLTSALQGAGLTIFTTDVVNPMSARIKGADMYGSGIDLVILHLPR